MSAVPGPFNAVCYAQFNLQGGWRRLLSISFAYGVLIGLAIWLSSMGQHHRQSVDTVQGWLGALTGLQILTLLVFGSYRVDSAVRNDVNSRMIESHRLMPASPLGSILGYIFSSPLQALMVGITNVLIGIACCDYTGMRVDLWLQLNGILVLFAFTLYAVLAQFSLLSRGGFLLAFIFGIVISVSAGNEVLQVVPGLDVLTSSLLGRNSAVIAFFDSARMRPGLNVTYLCALTGQAAIAAICICIAIRRYQSAAIIGTSPALGLLLLATWAAISLLYLAFPTTFPSFRNYRESSLIHSQVVATFGTCLLLAILPIASAVKTRDQLQKSSAIGSTLRGERQVYWVPLIAAVIICMILLDAPGNYANGSSIILFTPLIVLLYILGISCLISWTYRIRRKPWLFMTGWIVLTWIGPIVGDAIYRAMTDVEENATRITACSPIGAIALLWSGSDVSIVRGVVVQAVATLIPAGLLLMAMSSRRQLHVASATS